MEVRGLAWVGFPTADHGEARSFLIDVLGIRPWVDVPDFTVADLENGDRIELFGPSAARPHLTSPVVGLLVDDVDEARAELEAKGVEFVEPTGADDDGRVKWAHFRGPGGWVLELLQNPDHPLLGGR
jgi:Glyoxalase/Bleomycin resistance protein/Dioxygenase superfamily